MSAFTVRISDGISRGEAIKMMESMGWTVDDSKHVPGHTDPGSGITLDVDHWVLSCTSEDAPPEAEGKMIEPQIARDWRSDAMRVVDWGVPDE